MGVRIDRLVETVKREREREKKKKENKSRVALSFQRSQERTSTFGEQELKDALYCSYVQLKKIENVKGER